MKKVSEQKSVRPLHVIAYEIKKDWGKKMYFGAVPYVEAMSVMDGIEERYIQDSGKEIVNRFLSNASTWRGEKAREIKKELKGML